MIPTVAFGCGLILGGLVGIVATCLLVIAQEKINEAPRERDRPDA